MPRDSGWNHRRSRRSRAVAPGPLPARYSAASPSGGAVSGRAARPPLLYWRGATIECMHRVWALRAEGTAAFFTIDAGPQVKVLCQTAAAERVMEVLRDTPGVERILTCAPGGGAEVLA